MYVIILFPDYVNELRYFNLSWNIFHINIKYERMIYIKSFMLFVLVVKKKIDCYDKNVIVYTLRQTRLK